VSQAAVKQASCSGELHDLREADNVVKRAIPAKVKRRVLDRDGHRCLVPNCGAMAGLEIHHEDKWINGHDPSRMPTLCWWHHRARHEGRLLIEGAAPNFRFLLVDGTQIVAKGQDVTAIGARAAGSQGDFSHEKSANEQSAHDARLALVGLEMREREAKKRVQVALDREPGRAWDTDELIRAAFRAG
jgi:hypothetical protein